MTMRSAEPSTGPWTDVLALPFAAMAITSEDIAPITGGLPSGACLIDALNLVVAATPCSAPMFSDTVERVGHLHGRDVLLIRTDFAPEVLNSVCSDVALVGGDPVLLRELVFFRHVDRSLWLVPTKGDGPSVLLDLDGLTLALEPPYDDPWQRSDGLARAAAEIVRLTRKRGR